MGLVIDVGRGFFAAPTFGSPRGNSQGNEPARII
jgi:hypothetical protein